MIRFFQWFTVYPFIIQYIHKWIYHSIVKMNGWLLDIILPRGIVNLVESGRYFEMVLLLNQYNVSENISFCTSLDLLETQTYTQTCLNKIVFE